MHAWYDQLIESLKLIHLLVPARWGNVHIFYLTMHARISMMHHELIEWLKWSQFSREISISVIIWCNLASGSSSRGCVPVFASPASEYRSQSRTAVFLSTSTLASSPPPCSIIGPLRIYTSYIQALLVSELFSPLLPMFYMSRLPLPLSLMP